MVFFTFFSLNTFRSWYIHFSLRVVSSWGILSFNLCCDCSALTQKSQILPANFVSMRYIIFLCYTECVFVMTGSVYRYPWSDLDRPPGEDPHGHHPHGPDLHRPVRRLSPRLTGRGLPVRPLWQTAAADGDLDSGRNGHQYHPLVPHPGRPHRADVTPGDVHGRPRHR